ncbi:UDP-N-acetylmuramyl-tripeptide synthetase [Candidatus Parcubacteria bacterium]|nr:UDP-N-acetylmuramyl-tripeptide synthetase [Candidatus Parcubacteria bacterium]
MTDSILQNIKKIIPRRLFNALAPSYHYLLALAGATFYGHPSKKLTVIAVTGTKGKSSTTEILNSIFEAAGHKTVLLNTIRWKVDADSKPNTRKMTIPGRFFIQRMLGLAVTQGCDTAIIELSSEAAKQYRHKFLYLDCLIFTNLSPEHIESHGSYEKYKEAKLALTESLCNRLKSRSVIVANGDDKEAASFLACDAEEKYTFTLRDGGILDIKDDGLNFTWRGERIYSPLRGTFNLYNCLAAATCAEAFGISPRSIKEGIEKLSLIRGRVEFVRFPAESPLHQKQKFDVVVDYAHTAGSLTELYTTFSSQKKICVLGNTGGGRDKWKRPEMARVADTFCDEIILTNEDPYDEDPDEIIKEMLPGFKLHSPTIIMDRRTAIAEAITRAKSGDAVLITGKGTDPYICIENNKKIPWSDYEVAKEELEKVLSK